MKNNLYTEKVNNIHAPDNAVEKAIKEAEKKASEIPSHNLRVRLIAAAASIVFISAAAVALFFSFGSRPPVRPSSMPINNPTIAAENTESTVPSETTAKAAERATVPASESRSEAPTESTATTTENSEEYYKPVTEYVHPAKPEPETEKRVETSSPPATEPAVTVTEATESVDIGIDVDSSMLCDDGRLYCMIAETGLSQIEDPEVFTDEHLILVKTKWETKLIKDPQYALQELVYNNNEKVSTLYYYNSAGEILYEIPLYY